MIEQLPSKVVKVKATRVVKTLINQHANELAQRQQKLWAQEMIRQFEIGQLGLQQIQSWKP